MRRSAPKKEQDPRLSHEEAGSVFMYNHAVFYRTDPLVQSGYFSSFKAMLAVESRKGTAFAGRGLLCIER